MEYPINETIEVFKFCEEKTSSDSDHDLLQEQIIALEEIKMSLNEYESMKYKINHFKDLISVLRAKDQNVFETIYSAWEKIKYSYMRGIGGMTVNERLSHLGLIDGFGASIGNPSKMRDVLKAAFLSSKNLKVIVSSQCTQAKRK